MKNMDEALNWLYSNRTKIKDIQLKRISFILNELKLYPSFRVVLVSGTNGKGSTVSMLESILISKGYKVGSFTSPFVMCFNERIRINRRDIEDSELLDILSYLYNYSEDYKKIFNDIIPFFELCLIASLIYFKNKKIDIGIFECGIGGRYDATNALNPDLSIITSIGYDHLDRLGATLDEILYHKIGIGRVGKPLLLALDKSYSLDKYKDECRIINIYDEVKDIKSGDNTSFTLDGISYTTSLRGSFQAYNASLAIKASMILDSNIGYNNISEGLKIRVPGRMDIISEDPLIIVDGAHNISAINELANNLNINKKLIFFYSGLNDKEYEKILKRLDSIASKFIFTYLDDIRATEPKVFKRLVSKDSIVYNNIEEAIKKIEINPDEALVVTGSLHFISNFLKCYKELNNN